MYREEKNGQVSISVILTVQTFEPQGLAESMESVLKQKGQLGSSERGEQEEKGLFCLAQVILVDLKEATDCVAWLEATYKEEERLIVLRAEEPITRGQGINWAAQVARGDYLAFLESGTRWTAEKLEKQVAYLEKNPNTNWIYGMAAIRGKEKAYRPDPALPPYKKAGSLFYDLLRENTLSLDTVVIRRDTFLTLGGMDEALPALVEEEFLLRLSLAHPVVYLEQVLAEIFPRQEDAQQVLAVRLLMVSEYKEELARSLLAEEVMEGLWQKAKEGKHEGIFWKYAGLLKEEELFAPILEKIWQEKHPTRELLLSGEPTVAGVVNCVGCCGCASICPVEAITMEPGKEGFLYPKVDYDTCILCGKCLKGCPTQNQLTPLTRPEKCYAIQGNEEAQRDSSSGGVFPLLAETVLARGGWVAGAVYDKDFRVKHVVSNRREDIFRMRSSKYVQSDSRGVFAQVRELLEEEKEVLFTGCPCQVAGLKAFLGKEYEKLYTVDVVCHGVPSPEIFEQYLQQHIQKQGTITEVSFRKKQVLGWKPGMHIQFQNGKVYTAKGYDPYMVVFLSNWGLRDCCYQCEFKQATYSDLTLGDFWGIERLDAQLEKGKGTSLVILNSQKGVRLMGEIRSELTALQSFSTRQAVAGNPNVECSV